MNTLVTGTFQAEAQAYQAVRKLIDSCVPAKLVRAIVPGSRRRLAEHESDGGHPLKEPGGILVSVKAPEYVAQCLAVKILRDYGACDIDFVNGEPQALPPAGVGISVPTGRSLAAA